MAPGDRLISGRAIWAIVGLFILTLTLGSMTVNAANGPVAPITPSLCIDSSYCAPPDTIPYKLASAARLTGYFVDSVFGSNNNSGKSDVRAWRSLSKAKKSELPVGADVWFKTGQESSNTIGVTWGCTENDRCILGTYWMNDGIETRGLPSGGNPGSKYTPQSSWEGHTFVGTYPKGFSKKTKNISAIKAVSGYVTVENLNCWKQNGLCISVDKDSYGHNIFDNVMSYINGIEVYVANRDDEFGGFNEVKNSEFYEVASCWRDEIMTGCRELNGWPKCTGHVRSSNNSFHNNLVELCSGEGSGNTEEGGNNRIHDNIFIGTRGLCMYVNGGHDNVFERNICIGGGRQSWADGYERATGDTGGFFSMSWESNGYRKGGAMVGNVFKNNLGIGVKSCLGWGVSSVPGSDGFSTMGLEYIGNTCLLAGQSIFSTNNIGPESAQVFSAGSVVIANNIFGARNPIDGDKDGFDAYQPANCVPKNDISNGYVVVFDNLLEGEKWDDPDCAGSSGLENVGAGLQGKSGDAIDYSLAGPGAIADGTRRFGFNDVCIGAASKAIGNGVRSSKIVGLTRDALNNPRGTGTTDIGAVLRASCF